MLDLEREVLPVCDHYWKEAVDHFRCTVSDEGSLMPDGEEYQVKELSSAVGQELRERHLQELPQMVDKVHGWEKGVLASSRCSVAR